jgi:hypothetical protein
VKILTAHKLGNLFLWSSINSKQLFCQYLTMNDSLVNKGLNIPQNPGQSILQEETGVLPVLPSTPKSSSWRARWAALAITKDLGKFQTAAPNVVSNVLSSQRLLT